MADCEELFAILGVVFPNRVRALLSNGSLEGMSGRFAFDTLQQIGERIEDHCPNHNAFATKPRVGVDITSELRLISLPGHLNIVVRYMHFQHDAKQPCQVLALAAGPADAVDELSLKSEESLPLSSKEMKLTLDLAAGRSLQDIAARDNSSIYTIRNQVKSALRSTGVHSQSQLVSLVRDWLF